MLFQWEVGGHPPDHVISTFLRAQKIDADVESFARLLFEGAVREIEHLDRLMSEHSEHWRPERMAATDRNILRVALYELLRHPGTPAAVVINEALEIAHRFSGPDAVQFVNGVLDGVRKALPTAGANP